MQSNPNALNRQFYSLFRQEPILLMLIELGQVDVGALCYWNIDSPGHEGLSSGFWALLGYETAEGAQLPRLLRQVINHDDQRDVLKQFQQHRDNPAMTYDQVVRYLHQDGSTVRIRWRGQVSCDTQGKPIWMIAVYTDVTNLKDSKLSDGQSALAAIVAGHQMVSVCANCKKVHDKSGGWRQIESFATEYPDFAVSHGICPDCSDELYPGLLKKH